MKLKKMDDQEVLNAFIEMLDDRVELNTGFVKNDDGNITHQVAQITCGEYTSVSQPEPLSVVLRVATAQEQGIALN